MLFLIRKKGELIRIGDDILILVAGSNMTTARIGVEAPPDKKIVKGEKILERRRNEDGKQ